MKTLKQFFFVGIILFVTLSLAACGGNSIDNAIDDFETIVEKYEDLAGQDQVSKEDLDKLQKESEEVGAKFKNLDEKQLTEEQKKRVEDLSARLMKAAFQVGMKAGFNP